MAPLVGPYKYIWLDALQVKCREAGRIVNVACLVCTGVNREERREILGLDVVTTEDGAGWLAFLRGLRARGQSGSALGVPRERLLSVREAAARLGVCTATVYKLCTQEKLPHMRVANAIRVAPADLVPGSMANRPTTA